MALTIAGEGFIQWVNRERQIAKAQDFDKQYRQPLVEKMVEQIIGNNDPTLVVEVFGERYALNVYQHGDNLWIADGAFLGHQLRTINKF